MDLGEKLLVLKESIIAEAEAKLNEAEAPPSIQAVVMDGVAAHFTKKAYMVANYRAISEADKSQSREKTGTPEELMKELKGGSE